MDGLTYVARLDRWLLRARFPTRPKKRSPCIGITVNIVGFRPQHPSKTAVNLRRNTHRSARTRRRTALAWSPLGCGHGEPPPTLWQSVAESKARARRMASARTSVCVGNPVPEVIHRPVPGSLKKIHTLHLRVSHPCVTPWCYTA